MDEIGTLTNYFKHLDFVPFFISIFANVNERICRLWQSKARPLNLQTKIASLRGLYST